MTKFISVLLGAGLIALAAVQPAPAPVLVPADPLVEAPNGLSEFAFCPGWRADGSLESELRGHAAEVTDVSVSWWNGDSSSMTLPANRVPPITSDLRQGIVPVMLEADGPVGYSIRSEGAIGRASLGCASWPSSGWVVGVGSSLEDDSSTFVIMNPFPQTAVVDIRVYSEQGLEVVESLEGFAIPAGESREVPLSELLRLRTHMLVVVDDPEQMTFSALFAQRHDEIGTAVGQPLAEQWSFPAVPAGTTTQVVIVNPSAIPVNVDVDHFGLDGSTLAAEQFTMEKRSTRIIDVPEETAVQIRADREIGAAMRSETDSGLGIMTGIRLPSTTWALPGASLDGEFVNVSITNAGPTPATASYQFVGPGGNSEPKSFEVPAGATVIKELRAFGSLGIVIAADQPILVGWSVVGAETDLVLDAAVAK